MAKKNEIELNNKTELDSSSETVEVFKGKDPTPYILKIGSIFYKNDGNYFRLYKVIRIEDVLYHYSEHKIRTVFYEDCISFEKSQLSLSDLTHYYSIVNDVDIDMLKSLSNEIYLGEKTINEINASHEIDESKTTALAVTKSKEYYATMLENYRRYSSSVDIIKGFIQLKVNAMKDQISHVQRQFLSTIEKLNEILFTLELYGGICEEVRNIRQGAYADLKEPTYLQQDMLFMDEEVGDPENGGVSYDTVDKFYSWLNKFNNHLGFNNFELLLPHPKCVAIMRVRRHQTQYDNYTDKWNNQYRLNEEMKTCMLIRNGQNVWVIHSKMHFETKLFPAVEELQNLIAETNEKDEKNSRKLLNNYKNGMILIQGLFDRTDLLAPQGTLNILNLESIAKGLVVYNYSKLLIEDPKDKKFFKWVFKETDVKEGCRILFHSFNKHDSLKGRVTKYYYSDYSLPEYPKTDIYTVELYEDKPSFLYLQSGEIYNELLRCYTPRKRKDRVYVKASDNIINFDEFSHRDLAYINAVLYDRKHRADYLWIVPLLKSITEFKNEEYEQERPFMLMLKGLYPNLSEDTLLDYIFHWKTKNKWKRSLKSDDDRAYRMICKKIKIDLKENNLLSMTANFST